MTDFLVWRPLFRQVSTFRISVTHLSEGLAIQVVDLSRLTRRNDLGDVHTVERNWFFINLDVFGLVAQLSLRDINRLASVVLSCLQIAGLSRIR